MLHGLDEVLMLECSGTSKLVLKFAKYNVSHLSQKVPFRVICPPNIHPPIAFWIIQVVFGKLEMSGNVESSGFLPASLLCTPFLFSVFLMMDS